MEKLRMSEQSLIEKTSRDNFFQSTQLLYSYLKLIMDNNILQQKEIICINS